MRISGILILVVLLSMAIVVVLQSRDVTAKQEALTVISTQLREEGVSAARFDRGRAYEVVTELERLVDNPDSVRAHTEDLKTIAATAASWAAGAASPSPELHASVAIRTAAAELRSHGVRPSDSSLRAARYQLEKARSALDAPSGGGDGTSAPSGLVTEGVRDRLHNLEAAQKERALEVDEELGP